MDMQVGIERSCVKALSRRRIFAVAAGPLLMSLAGRSQDEITQSLIEEGIDSVLVVRLSGRGAESTWNPMPTTTTTKTTATGSAARIGRYVTGSAQSEQTTTTSGGGFTSVTSWANTKAALYDINTDRIIWQASLASSTDWGDAYIPASIGKELAKILADNHLVRPKGARRRRNPQVAD